MHVLNRPDAAFVNTFVIETSGHTVVIDPGATAEHGVEVRALIDSLGKPLAAVLLTHAHIDHYGALKGVDRGRAPLVASAGTAWQLETWDSINYARFGMTVRGGQHRPDRTMGDGETWTVDGVTFHMFDAGPGESYADAWWLITAGSRAAAVIGDLAMWGLPPFLQSGHSRDWLASLDRVERALPAGAAIYIGHDLAAAGVADPRRDASILDWQRQRLHAFRRIVSAATNRNRLLSEAEIPDVVTALHRDAPENLEAFDFLITTSANVLAAELILEKQKSMFEERLKAAIMKQTS
jgi:glyoxylase-like metal-dependent hydrolase (beta-lactamase superfamily II)